MLMFEERGSVSILLQAIERQDVVNLESYAAAALRSAFDHLKLESNRYPKENAMAMSSFLYCLSDLIREVRRREAGSPDAAFPNGMRL